MPATSKRSLTDAFPDSTSNSKSASDPTSDSGTSSDKNGSATPAFPRNKRARTHLELPTEQRAGPGADAAMADTLMTNTDALTDGRGGVVGKMDGEGDGLLASSTTILQGSVDATRRENGGGAREKLGGGDEYVGGVAAGAGPVEVQMAMKRPRGRPLGSTKKAKEGGERVVSTPQGSVDTPSGIGSGERPGGENDRVGLIKRPRGRPKGSTKKTREDGAPMSSSLSTPRDRVGAALGENGDGSGEILGGRNGQGGGSIAGSAETPVPTNRPRGRPKGSTNKRPSNDVLWPDEERHEAEAHARSQNGERPEKTNNLDLSRPNTLDEGSRRGTNKTSNLLFYDPAKQKQNGNTSLIHTADHSAARKSARSFIQRTIAGDHSSDEALDDEEDLLAARIRAGSGDNDDDTSLTLNGPPTAKSQTPSKKRPGRPPGVRRKSPTPPRDMSAYERYFFETRPSGSKTSSNTLSSLTPLTHDEYFSLMRAAAAAGPDRHEKEMRFLEDMHSRSFPQWRFEMQEGFNVCLFGWGSKRGVLLRYAEWLSAQYQREQQQQQNGGAQHTPPPPIVVVNGYAPNLTLREIYTTIGRAISPSTPPPTDLSSLLPLLSSLPHALTLLLPSLDAPPLRPPRHQSALARLAAHSSLNLLASADSPSFPLLWDSALAASLRFLYHDTTSFRPFAPELDVLAAWATLLGHPPAAAPTRQAARFVLKSLPANARALYSLLVTEQLKRLHPSSPSSTPPPPIDSPTDNPQAISYPHLYALSLQSFICSSEMAFRSLLKEFVDHQMLRSRRDTAAGGEEMLWAPFQYQELCGIQEDLEEG
ncbi:MAG: Origin recognition complex subunit 2 [Vezdaea acicularis]|nr:MAG: Origin recognition complex subunit 2 [Vezdaea acicularis]